MKEFKYKINGTIYNVVINRLEDAVAELEVNGTPYTIDLCESPKKNSPIQIKKPVQVSSGATTQVVKKQENKPTSGKALKSPLPGVILSIDCNIGDTVKKGEKLLILEAMKMENSINADKDGKIVSICIKTGDSVLEGADLVVIE